MMGDYYLYSAIYIIFRRGWLFLGICTAALFTSLCLAQGQINSEPLELTAAEQQWINEHPSIRSTNYTQWPPLDFIEAGKPSGFSVDYLQLVARKVGLNIEYVSGENWPALMNQAQQREIDIMQSVSNSGNREKYWHFTAPYLNFKMTFYGKIGAEKVLDTADLVGRKIGVVDGWSSHTILTENYKELDIVTLNSVQEALISLSAGNIDIFVDRLQTSNYIIAKNFITGIEVIGQDILPESVKTDNLRFAVRKDWPILVSILEKGMEQVSQPEYAAIAEKWQAEYNLDIGFELSLAERNWLSENKIFTVASDPNLAPVESIDQAGKVSGIAGAYLNLIGEKLGIEFRWIGNQTWTEGLEKARAGEVDLIASVSPTPARSQYLDFTDNYLVISEMIFSRNDNPGYVSMSSLNGRKIAQIRNYVLTEAIKRDFPDLEVVEVDDPFSALQMLSDGEVDAHIGVISVTSNKIAQSGFDNISVSGETPYKSVSAFGIRKELPLLGSAMQKALNSITPAQKAEFSRNWLSLNIEADLNKLIFNIAMVVVSVILIIIIWAGSLRREINRRKQIEVELRATQNAAETANAAKSTFLANMSHEIRTPLNAIIGFSDVISSGIFGEVTQPKYREYLEDIKGSGQHLAVVINDILDLSKIEAGKWQMTDVDFELLRTVEDSVWSFNEEVRSRDIDLSISILDENRDMAILADESCIKRIVDNLVSNAVKFTLDGGKITCLIKKLNEGGVLFEVADNGVGIPKDRLAHVLSPFGQDHELKSLNKGGTGLGLSIVDQLIALHGGKFTLNSEVGVGTKAAVFFPESRILD